MGIAFIIFMGLFIKCCAVHIPSTNPKKPPARRISDTLTRPMNTLRRMVRKIRRLCLCDFSSVEISNKKYVKMMIIFFVRLIICRVYCSDIRTVEEDLGHEVYLRGQVRVDTEHVDPPMVTEKVEVLSIIQKVS